MYKFGNTTYFSMKHDKTKKTDKIRTTYIQVLFYIPIYFALGQI